MDNLRYIRGMMERAATFTAVSGWGQVVIGITAIVAALVAARQTSPWTRVATWVAEAGIAAGLSVASMALKSHAANVPLVSGPIEKTHTELLARDVRRRGAHGGVRPAGTVRAPSRHRGCCCTAPPS